MVQDDLIYKLLNVNKSVALAYFVRLRYLKGIKCNIHWPTQDDSIFGQEDALINYSAIPDKEDVKLLCFNLFQNQEDLGSDSDFSSFQSEPCFALILKNELDDYPVNSQISINFLGNNMLFRIEKHSNLVPHIQDQFIIKLILVPAT